MSTYTIASRESKLALVQTQHVASELGRTHIQHQFPILGMTTKGDQILDKKLDRIGGKGLFIKELEDALLKQSAQFAVHSAKDLPARMAQGLALVATSKREDARDVLISRTGCKFSELPQGSVVGTASARREMQLLEMRPDLQVRMLRGNVQTRLAKLESGEFDAILLAAAGLHRLGLAHQITEYLDPTHMIPAVGQGILAIEAPESLDLQQVLAPIHNSESWDCLNAERSFMLAMNGDCSVPLAAYAQINDDHLEMQCAYGHQGHVYRSQGRALRAQSQDLGLQCAQDIMAQMGVGDVQL